MISSISKNNKVAPGIAIESGGFDSSMQRSVRVGKVDDSMVFDEPVPHKSKAQQRRDRLMQAFEYECQMAHR